MRIPFGKNRHDSDVRSVDHSARLAPYRIVGALWAFGASLAYGAEAIKINILEGDGAVNSIQARRAREPVIRVETESGLPAVGAVVHFTAPNMGPGAVFADGNSTFTTVTDREGHATAASLRPNRSAGQFQIRVSATYLGETASARITQTNAESPNASKGSAKKIAIFAILGAAAAGGAFAAKGGGGKSTPATSPGTVITLGSPSLGAP